MAVLRVYDTLLSQRGGDEIAEQAHLPIVRLALLRSQLNLMTPLARQLLDRPGIGVVGQSAGFRREVVFSCACTESLFLISFNHCLNLKPGAFGRSSLSAGTVISPQNGYT